MNESGEKEGVEEDGKRTFLLHVWWYMSGCGIADVRGIRGGFEAAQVR